MHSAYTSRRVTHHHVAYTDLDEGTCHERLRRIIHMGLRDVMSRSRRDMHI